MRRGIAALIACLCLFCVAARAEEQVDRVLERVDLSGLTEWASESESEIDAEDTLRKLSRGDGAWDIADAAQALKDMLLDQLRESLAWLGALVFPALLGALLSLAASPGLAGTAGWVCYLATAAQLSALYATGAVIAQNALNQIGALTETLYPMLAALLAASGKATGAAMFTPVAAMAGGLVSTVIDQSALALGGIAAALAIAGNLSERLPLEGLAKLARGALKFVLTAALTTFTGLLSVQGLLARGYDSASIQTARFAIGSLVPVVGGEVADSLDALMSSAGLVKNAAGVTGLILLVGACLKPILRLLALAFCARAAAAIVEPLGKSPAQRMLKDFAPVMSMLPAAVIGGAVLLVVLVGAALTVFGG